MVQNVVSDIVRHMNNLLPLPHQSPYPSLFYPTNVPYTSPTLLYLLYVYAYVQSHLPTSHPTLHKSPFHLLHPLTLPPPLPNDL